MNEDLKKYSCVERCPVRQVISRFSSKWAMLVLMILGEKECVRFNEFTHILPDISAKVLSSTLKTLESDGLVARKVYACVPPKVEYSITNKGKTLVPLICQLVEWAREEMV